MSEGPNLVPGAPRKRNYYGLNNNLPAHHVDLGRVGHKGVPTGPGGLHILVKQDDGGWLTLCKGRPAEKSYKGRPYQAGCQACKAAAMQSADGAA